MQNNRIFADEIDTRDMAVEIDAHRRPVETRRHLFDMRRLARAMIARDDDAAVARKACENGERRVAIEEIFLVELRNMLAGGREGRHFHVGIDSEQLAHLDLGVGHGEGRISRLHHTSKPAGHTARGAILGQ